MTYRVEIDQPGCAACGSGQTWWVVGPDDVASITSYGLREDAEALAGVLNRAYRDGAKAATPNRRTGPENRRVGAPTSGTLVIDGRVGLNGRRRDDEDIPF